MIITATQLHEVETYARETGHHEAAIREHIAAKEFLGERVVFFRIGHSVVQFEQGLGLLHAFGEFLRRALSGIDDKFFTFHYFGVFYNNPINLYLMADTSTFVSKTA